MYNSVKKSVDNKTIDKTDSALRTVAFMKRNKKRGYITIHFDGDGNVYCYETHEKH